MGALSWSLTDPELDLLGRVGVAAIALALDSARECGHDLSPLEGHYNSTTLDLSWPDDVTDQDALVRLIEWAWQTRGASPGGEPGEGMGILYLPGVHRGDGRDDLAQRLVEHSGILSTFLQHPTTQPKTKPKTMESRIDDRVIHLRYVEPTATLAYLKDAKKLFNRKSLKTDAVTFSSYIRPGATARHSGEDSWSGSAREAIALIFAPTACFYLQIHGKDWVVVAPDPGDIEEFVRRRPDVTLSQNGTIAASVADAGLRVIVAMRARATARQLQRGRGIAQECMVLRVGKVAWNKQSVRNRALRLHPAAEVIDAFQCLDRRLSNRLRERADGDSAFVVVPSPRAIIADNLIAAKYWYRNLFEIPTDLCKQVEKNRRTGESVQRVWFRWVRSYGKELSALMEDLEKLKLDAATDIDAVFHDAFRLALRNLYGREKAQAQRGSRSVNERQRDRTEKIRRELMKAQTRQHVRGVIAEIFAEAGRNRVVQSYAQEIWRFIDNPQDWRRARDLALLSLATYARMSGDEGAVVDEEQQGEHDA